MKIIIKIVTGLLCLIFISIQGSAVEVKSLKSFQLSQSDDIIIQDPYAYVVTNDDRILLADYKAGNIKIFDMTGKRVKIFGSKGVGPNEFLRPLWMSYKEPFILVMDRGRRTGFIFKRKENDNFEFTQKFLNIDGSYDVSLLDRDNVMIAGDKYDKNKLLHDLCSFNIKKKTRTFIVPSYIAYHCETDNHFWKEKRARLRYIDLNLRFDISPDSIYMAWAGSLKITKVNRKTKEATRFGKESKNFVTPHASQEIIKAFRQMDHRKIWKLQRAMSFVKDIFVTTTGTVGIIFNSTFKEDRTNDIWVQFFTENGEFLNETHLLKSRADYHNGVICNFRKSDNHLYLLDRVPEEDSDNSFIMHEFQVKE